ncbi:site-2 protease family protein [Flavobacterium aquariorum]|uniref:Zinc metalloprotease n=1 Tax=Flavobacterium aquariorum TaxID=2217670 RepID=A0A2W7UHK8_9FLAO|nr:site-2 protease family protein [Flavobacterium aquariorum]PZX94677.1 site-2 protease family protein [Flavobacterium aquariorum]
MKGLLRLGTISGIGIFMHWTFVLLIAFIVVINYKNGQSPGQIAWSILFILCVFITVLLHELGHALMAKKYNINTKSITLLPIGGIARLERLPEKPVEELFVAIAGPIVNLMLAAITQFFVLIPLDSEKLLSQLGNGINSQNFFLNFYIVNITLAFFNLIPAFPMDGGRILRALLAFKLDRKTATMIAARIGQFIAIGFIFIGIISNPVLVLIGFFVIFSAQIEAESVNFKNSLKGYTAGDVAMKEYQTIAADEKLKKAIAIILNSEHKKFLVTQNDTVVGVLCKKHIIKALSEKGNEEYIYNVMDRNLLYIDASAPLENIIDSIYENKSTVLLVKKENLLIGILDADILSEFVVINSIKVK